MHQTENQICSCTLMVFGDCASFFFALYFLFFIFVSIRNTETTKHVKIVAPGPQGSREPHWPLEDPWGPIIYTFVELLIFDFSFHLKDANKYSKIVNKLIVGEKILIFGAGIILDSSLYWV